MFVRMQTLGRRQFLGALAGASFLPFYPHSKPRDLPLIVGLRAAGTKIQRRVQDSNVAARYWVWDRPLITPAATGSTRLTEVPFEFLGRSRKHLQLRKFVSATIQRAGTNPRRVLIVLGLGGCCGSSLATILTEQFLHRTDRVFVGCSTPFQFQGRRQSRRSDVALAVLRRMGCELRVIESEMLLSTARRGIPFGAALEEINGLIAATVREWLA